MSKRRNWLWILFGVAIVVVFLAIGAVIVTTAWVQQNLQITETTERSAQQEFDAVRTRYAGRLPLLEMKDGRPAYAAGKPPERRPGQPDLQRLQILVWDPGDGRLASFSIPFWLLRLKSGTIDFSAYTSGFDDERVNLRPEEIDKYGPGIILDMTGPKGEFILLYAE